MRSEQSAAFCEKVRAAYLEVYGTNPFDEDTDDRNSEPFTLETVVVAFEASHIDGEHSSILLYDGSELTAVGLATRAIQVWGI